MGCNGDGGGKLEMTEVMVVEAEAATRSAAEAENWWRIRRRGGATAEVKALAKVMVLRRGRRWRRES